LTDAERRKKRKTPLGIAPKRRRKGTQGRALGQGYFVGLHGGWDALTEGGRLTVIIMDNETIIANY
jgi:hypothetical protein